MIEFEQNRVVEPASTVRAMARQVLEGRWLEALLVSVLMYVITTVPSLVIPYLTQTTFALSAVNAYSLIITGPAALGMCIYFVHVFREQPGGVEHLLRGFQYAPKAVMLFVLIVVRVFFLSLLLILPGIWAALRYSQAFFILADSPEKTARQCLWESSLLMRNNIGKLFWLEASFLGWALLASMPPAFGLAVRTFAGSGILFPPLFGWKEVANLWLEQVSAPLHPLFALLGIGSLFLGIYMGVAHACFYDLANGNLKVQRAEDIRSISDDEL